MIDPEHRETDGGCVSATVSIADGVGEGIRSDVAAVRCIEQRAVVVVRDRSVGRLRETVDAECIAVDVAVVGQRGYGDRYVLIGGCRVIICRGSIIDWIDGNGHRGRIRTTLAVTNLVNETVFAVEVCSRCIGERAIRLQCDRAIGGSGNGSRVNG